MKKYYDIKEPDVNLKELPFLQWPLAIVLHYIIGYADMHSLPVKITSISEKIARRKSRSHDEFRAVDIATRLWSDEHLSTLKRRVNAIFYNWGTGPVKGKKQVFVWEPPDHLNHIHLQVRRNIKIDDIGSRKIFNLNK